MKIFDFSKHKKLYVCGDIHGEFKKFFNEIRRRASKCSEEKVEDVEKEDDETFAFSHVLDSLPTTLSIAKEKTIKEKEYDNAIIIVAGDISLGFNSLQYYQTEFNKINPLLEQINSYILFVRGNHDDPSFFSEDKLGFSNIKTVPDYSVVLTENYKTLCVGGSISYDRTWRQERSKTINKYRSESQHKKQIYWDNEQFVFDADALDEILKEFKIDSVVTHTYPRGINNIRTKDSDAAYWFEKDAQLEKDILFENENVKNLGDKIENNNHIKFWASGHVHVLNTFIEKDTAFLQLKDDCRPFDIKNVDFMFEKQKRPNHKKASLFEAYDVDSVLSETLRTSARVQFRPQFQDIEYDPNNGQPQAYANINDVIRVEYNAAEPIEEAPPF